MASSGLRWRTVVMIGLVALQAVALVVLANWLLPPVAGWHRGDLTLYQRAGQRVLQGELPYRDFPLEYPPGALAPFTLPHLVAGRRLTVTQYTGAFLAQSVVLSTLVATGLALLTARWWRPGRPPTPPILGGFVVRTLVLWTALVVVGAGLLPWRYDLFPALLTLAALLAALAGRPTLAGVALGLGVAAKLYPVVLLPVLGLSYLVERRPRAIIGLGLGCAGAVGLVLLPFLSLDLVGWAGSLGFYGTRGLGIETLPGGALLLANLLRLTRVGVTTAVGAYQLVAPLADEVARWQPLALLVGYGAVLVSCWRRFTTDRQAVGRVRPASLVVGLVLALLVFIVTNKVFSAQHLIWTLPLAALLPLRQALLLLLAWALTNLLFPWHYEDLTDGGALAVFILNARNLAVLALIVWLLVEPWTSGRGGQAGGYSPARSLRRWPWRAVSSSTSPSP